MSRHASLALLFALLALFFGWKCYEAWNAPLPVPAAPARAQAARPAVQGAAPPAAPDLGTLVTAVAVRPLFRPDRAPFRESAAAVPQRNYEAEIARFTVVGVVALDGPPKAIVTGQAAGAGGRSERYEVGPGDSLPGFTVKEVRPEGVVVAADGREFTIPLFAGAPRAAARTETSTPRAAPGQAATGQQPAAPRTPAAAGAAAHAPQPPAPAPSVPAAPAPAPARMQRTIPDPGGAPAAPLMNRRLRRPAYVPGLSQPPNQ